MKITRPNNLWVPESISLDFKRKKEEEEKLLKLTLIEKQWSAISLPLV